MCGELYFKNMSRMEGEHSQGREVTDASVCDDRALLEKLLKAERMHQSPQFAVSAESEPGRVFKIASR